jgi:hypothetical protein
MFSKLATTLKTESDKILTEHQETKAEYERTGKIIRHTESSRFVLPIKKINDINVEVGLKIFKNFSGGDMMMNFQITTNIYIHNSSNDCCEPKILYDETFKSTLSNFDVAEYETILEKIYKTIPILKMNNRTNTFITEPDLDNEELALLITHPNVETKSCCVCFEVGGITTCCNHIVCISCIDKIKPSREDEDDGYILCPLCRVQIGSK